MNQAMLFGGGSRINTKNYGLYINVWEGRLCHFLDHIRWCNLLVGDDHITCNSDQNISVDREFSYSG